MADAWPRCGEIWSSYTPGQPKDPHQPRPALVVSDSARNRLHDDVIVIPIFSEGALGPTRVPLTKGLGGLRYDSVLFCEEISTVDRQFLAHGPWGRPVSDDILGAAIRGVRRALGEVVAES